MIGRRVENIGELEHSGDYCLDRNALDEVTALSFILPTGDHGRIPAVGHGRHHVFATDPEPEWTIAVESDGTVSVDPSINYVGHWHGFLKCGVWS